MKTSSRAHSIQDLFSAFQEMKQDVLGAFQVFATDTEVRLSRLETKFRDVETAIVKLESKVDGLESRMVTKDYLDDKIADLRGDLVVLSRKSNKKLETVIEELVANHSLKRSVADRILAMEPFAQHS
ncbi:hypothetical protein KBD34_01105 [Patescibacteria group bacterium]|nr:hypothetical protein [Patescibacteria group bacterium]